MRKLTLIGGAPLTGKTTMSRKIAHEDGAVELSSDSIRDWMQNTVRQEEYPDLFHSVGKTAEEFYEVYTTAQSVVDEQVSESREVEKGIIALLNSEITWEHLVIEGIAITPSFMLRIAKDYKDRELEFVIMADHNRDRIESRIHDRGLWGPRGTYPESLIPKEVKWVILYNQWFIEQAQKHNIEISFND